MLKEALEYLAGLGAANRFEVESLALDSVFFDKPLYRPDLPRPEPVATVRAVSTLRSLALYLRANVDKLDLASHLLHVSEPGRVDLISALEEYHRRRETPVAALYDSGVSKVLDRWLDLETGIISLISLFTPAGDRDLVLETLKSVRRENAEIRDDSGLSQAVTVKAGVASLATAKTPNPVTLFPYSAFPEADQVPRLFVLRLRGEGGGIEVLLKTADGDAWKTAAVEKVAQALEFALGDLQAPEIIY